MLTSLHLGHTPTYTLLYISYMYRYIHVYNICSRRCVSVTLLLCCAGTVHAVLMLCLCSLEASGALVDHLQHHCMATHAGVSAAHGLSAAVEKRLMKAKFITYLVVLKHSHLYYYRDEDEYVSNRPEMDVYWLKYCRLREIHMPGAVNTYVLALYDLRLDKTCLLAFDTGLAREDWLQAILSVQEAIGKGLIAVKTFGKSAKEQQEQALEILAERRRENAGAEQNFKSMLSDDERYPDEMRYSLLCVHFYFFIQVNALR